MQGHVGRLMDLSKSLEAMVAADLQVHIIHRSSILGKPR